MGVVGRGGGGGGWGGAEGMLEGVLEGAREEGHEVEPVFFEQGSWPETLRRGGFRVEVLEAGRLREPHRFIATVARLASLVRTRRPDLMMKWGPKTQLSGAPAAALARAADPGGWVEQA